MQDRSVHSTGVQNPLSGKCLWESRRLLARGGWSEESHCAVGCLPLEALTTPRITSFTEKRFPSRFFLGPSDCFLSLSCSLEYRSVSIAPHPVSDVHRLGTFVGQIWRNLIVVIFEITKHNAIIGKSVERACSKRYYFFGYFCRY